MGARGKPNVVVHVRKPGPEGQQPCAGQSTAEQANHEEDVKQRSAAEGVQAVSVAKSELVTKDAEGESEMRPEKAKPETVVIRKKLPKSTTSSESGGSGKSRVSGVP